MQLLFMGRAVKTESRPVEMRDDILCLANRWMYSKMLLTPSTFLYLIVGLLLSHFYAKFSTL